MDVSVKGLPCGTLSRLTLINLPLSSIRQTSLPDMGTMSEDMCSGSSVSENIIDPSVSI